MSYACKLLQAVAGRSAVNEFRVAQGSQTMIGCGGSGGSYKATGLASVDGSTLMVAA